ncbi:hypothetical protein NDU88_007816 [Pleurodeles waltl]|uniref:Uncharacterized protein n=1 Tax=Pleurodeles waltl TaxID=8319 RepID=A0AAV7NU53_PLEWA|nr:hypothetical protein NDU88_007816 [Pleurodeles waltl]
MVRMRSRYFLNFWREAVAGRRMMQWMGPGQDLPPNHPLLGHKWMRGMSSSGCGPEDAAELSLLRLEGDEDDRAAGVDGRMSQ